MASRCCATSSLSWPISPLYLRCISRGLALLRDLLLELAQCARDGRERAWLGLGVRVRVRVRVRARGRVRVRVRVRRLLRLQGEGEG